VPEMSEAIGLDALGPGRTGRVRAVDAEAPLATRLADLGFCPGTPVRMLRRAPLGDPLLFELRGYQIALRRTEARWIRVLPDAPDAGERAPETGEGATGSGEGATGSGEGAPA